MRLYTLARRRFEDVRQDTPGQDFVKAIVSEIAARSDRLSSVSCPPPKSLLKRESTQRILRQANVRMFQCLQWIFH